MGTLAEDALEREAKRYERYVTELARDLRTLADTVERTGRIRKTAIGVGVYSSTASDVTREVLSSFSQQQLPKIIEAAGECDLWRGVIAGETHDPTYTYEEKN